MIIGSHTFKEDIAIFKNDQKENQKTIEELYQLKKINKETDMSSNFNGWQKDINNEKKYENIKNMIVEEFKNYFKTNLNVSIIHLFANINPPGASHVMHTHQGGQYSGAYWLQADKHAGNVIVMNPFINEFVSNCISIAPEPNTGVFFNSNIVHYVDVNRSKRDRIGFGFHLNISGD